MSIEHCPRCSARVRVPAAAEPESWVRCPRCRAETQLSELLAAEPPELELIDGPSGAVPAYAPMMAGGGAEGEEYNEFHVMAGDTLVTDEDSPTLPIGGVALTENFLDDESSSQGAVIGKARKATSEDDELFGFDDDQDVEALRTTSDDGKLIDVPADGGEEFNLSPDTPAEMGAAAVSPATLGAGFSGIPTGAPRRRKKSGMLPMMIGVVGGGLFGIVIAYYGILMWAMGQDPFKVAKYFPESMQMLLPESLKSKAVAKTTTPPENPDSTPSENPSENTPPEGTPSTPGTENGSGETGSTPSTPNTEPGTTPMPETPATNPINPLVMPEKPETPPKPATDLNDPFGNTAPVKPAELPGATESPVKPADNPLDPFGNNAPVKPEMPAKPDVTTPAPGDPFDPSIPVKPEMPAKPETPIKPEVALPTTPDPLEALTPKTNETPAAPAKSNEPVMLASASFTPADLEQSLTEAKTSHEALAQKPDDKMAQIAAYRALSHLGEVAAQLKSLGDTPEKTAEILKSLQTTSKNLVEDPIVTGVAKWTSMWLTVDPKNRKGNNGIVIQATPGTTEPAGKYQRTSVEIVIPGATPEMNQTLKLPIVSEYPLVPNGDGKITILGVIVDKPTEQIPGYAGPMERVIWVSVGEMEKPDAAPAGDAGAAPAPAPAKTPADDPFGDLK